MVPVELTVRAKRDGQGILDNLSSQIRFGTQIGRVFRP